MKLTMISIFVCVFIVASGFQAIGEEWTAEQKEVWSVVEQYYSNIGPTLRFLISKEIEITNLKIISKGLAEQLPAEKILPLLTMEVD